MAYDALAALREGGHWVELLSDRQRLVLAELTEEEVAVLTKVKRRLDEAAPEVEGQELKVF